MATKRTRIHLNQRIRCLDRYFNPGDIADLDTKTIQLVEARKQFEINQTDSDSHTYTQSANAVRLALLAAGDYRYIEVNGTPVSLLKLTGINPSWIGLTLLMSDGSEIQVIKTAVTELQRAHELRPGNEIMQGVLSSESYLRTGHMEFHLPHRLVDALEDIEGSYTKSK